MAASPPLLFAFFTFSLLSLSSSVHQSIANAIDFLSSSGHYSMALTLQLTSPTLLEARPFATIFSPSDEAFVASGQPSLALLQFHISPVRFSPEHFIYLPIGAQIPTLLQNHSLIVTLRASDGRIRLNNVNVNGPAIYFDESLIVYGTDAFFDPSFEFTSYAPGLECSLSDLEASEQDSFHAAFDVLRSRGFSAVASFLGVQILPLKHQHGLTVFAPTDAVLLRRWVNLTDYMTVLKQHVVPCRLPGSMLHQLEDGTLLQTFAEGFVINVGRSGAALVLNGVRVTSPDLYTDESLVVHGLPQVIPKALDENRIEDSTEAWRSTSAPDSQNFGEFGN